MNRRIIAHGIIFGSHFWKVSGLGVVTSEQFASHIGITRQALVGRVKRHGATSERLFDPPQDFSNKWSGI